jgi:hypothetical protein
LGNTIQFFRARSSGGIRAATYGLKLRRNVEMVTQLYFDFGMSFLMSTEASFGLQAACQENKEFLGALM